MKKDNDEGGEGYTIRTLLGCQNNMLSQRRVFYDKEKYFCAEKFSKVPYD